MLIPDELAQRIVDSTQCLIHCNVNLMNREGVIIATTQPERRQTFHKGARDVIETGLAVEILPDNTHLFPGAREGVNLPIVLNGKIIGVIGVTGVPDQVRNIASLTKMITELILERELLQKEMQNRQRTAEQLIETLLWGGGQVRGRTARLAKELGIDLDLPRAVAVADMTGLISGFFARYGASELVHERAVEAVLLGLTASGEMGPQDLVVILDERLIALKTVNPDHAPEQLRDWGKRLLRVFGQWRGEGVGCGVGAAARAIAEYPLSYRQARFCLDVSTRKAPFRDIYEHALCAHYFLREAAIGPAGMALAPLAKSLAAALAAKPELHPTLTALVAHNFEPEPTAHHLAIHRNTLTYRLARLRDATGLDPTRRRDDAILLRMLLAVGKN